jgi:hypothetical protein
MEGRIMNYLLIKKSGDSYKRMLELADIAKIATYDYKDGCAIVETLESVAEAYKNDVTVTLDALCINSTRYCLGRRSYVVNENCNNLRQLWPTLSATARSVILRDIEEELGRPDGGGMEMDRESWRSLLNDLEVDSHG